MTTPRTSDHAINPQFLNRWSPRAFDGQPMSKQALLTLLEAARWAPSAYNLQPWRFLYSMRGDTHWPTYLECLDPFNRSWAHTASALLILVSDTEMHAPEQSAVARSHYHSFDAGAAWAQLALQATLSGYQAHAMAGINVETIRRELQVPDRYAIQIAIAVGIPTPADTLPPKLQQREQPSARRKLSATAFCGCFPSCPKAC